MPRAPAMEARMPDLTTLPRLLQRNARELGARPAMREKDRGIWQTWNWRQYHDQVRDLALGLASLGLHRGDRLSVIGDNRPRLRSEEHTSELQSQSNLVCRLLLEKKK